jgi:hypothetical protein
MAIKSSTISLSGLFDASQKYVIVDVNRIARFRPRFKQAAFTHSRAPSLFIACLQGNHCPKDGYGNCSAEASVAEAALIQNSQETRGRLYGLSAR